MNKKMLLGLCILFLVSIVFATDPFHDNIEKIRNGHIDDFFKIAEAEEKSSAAVPEGANFKTQQDAAIAQLQSAHEIYQIGLDEFSKMGLQPEAERCAAKLKELDERIEELKLATNPDEIKEVIETNPEDETESKESKEVCCETDGEFKLVKDSECTGKVVDNSMCKKKPWYKKTWVIILAILLLGSPGAIAKMRNKSFTEPYKAPFRQMRKGYRWWRRRLNAKLNHLILNAIKACKDRGIAKAERLLVFSELDIARDKLETVFPKYVLFRRRRLEHLDRRINAILIARGKPGMEPVSAPTGAEEEVETREEREAAGRVQTPDEMIMTLFPKEKLPNARRILKRLSSNEVLNAELIKVQELIRISHNQESHMKKLQELLTDFAKKVSDAEKDPTKITTKIVGRNELEDFTDETLAAFEAHLKECLGESRIFEKLELDFSRKEAESLFQMAIDDTAEVVASDTGAAGAESGLENAIITTDTTGHDNSNDADKLMNQLSDRIREIENAHGDERFELIYALYDRLTNAINNRELNTAQKEDLAAVFRELKKVFETFRDAEKPKKDG